MPTLFKPPKVETDAARHIHTRLKAAREALGMTQGELAFTIHKTRAIISEMERGRIEINAEDLLTMAYAVEKPITYFYPDHPKVRGARPDELDNDEKELISSYRLIQAAHYERCLRQGLPGGCPSIDRQELAARGHKEGQELMGVREPHSCTPDSDP